LLLYSSHLPLGVPNGLVIYQASSTFSGAVAGECKNNLPRQLGAIKQQQDIFWRRCRGGRRRLLRGEFLHAHPLLCLLFCFIYFTCIILSKTKKI
jgi:hypothetical protein